MGIRFPSKLSPPISRDSITASGGVARRAMARPVLRPPAGRRPPGGRGAHAPEVAKMTAVELLGNRNALTRRGGRFGGRRY